MAGMEQARSDVVGENVISSFLFILTSTSKQLNPNERKHINCQTSLRDKLPNFSFFNLVLVFSPFPKYFPQQNFQGFYSWKWLSLPLHPSISIDALTPTLFKEERGECLYSLPFNSAPSHLAQRENASCCSRPVSALGQGTRPFHCPSLNKSL